MLNGFFTAPVYGHTDYGHRLKRQFSSNNHVNFTTKLEKLLFDLLPKLLLVSFSV